MIQIRRSCLGTAIHSRGRVSSRPARLLVLLVLAAFLSLTTLAVSLNALHSTNTSHNCEFCQFSYLPVVSAGGWMHFSTPRTIVAVVWSEEVGSEHRLTLRCQAPRAPPL